MERDLSNVEYRAFLSQEDRARGWVPIPDGCPPEVEQRILAFRDKAVKLVEVRTLSQSDRDAMRLRLAAVEVL